MNTTNERIFAKDTDMMFWQQDNCTQCAKAVWYNARLGRCPKHNCALQRDMEAQAGGEMEINERSFRVLHGVKRCPLFKPKDTTPDDSPVYDAHDFAKGKQIVIPEEAPKPKEEPKPQPVPKTYSPTPEEIKAAEERMLKTIWDKSIAPNIGEAIRTPAMWNNRPLPMTERQFKKLVADNTERMLETFTWEENMMIAVVPLIISKVAWVYAEKVLAYCAEYRLSEYKKHGRVVKMLRQEYIDTLCKDLDRRHVRHIETQTEQFMDEINHHLTILWLQANTYIKNTAGYDMAHDTMRTDAMVAILMVRYLKAHDNKMNAIIKAKMGHSESITNPQMIDLEGLMKVYLPNGFEVGTNYQLDLCAKIFENSLAKIEFDITD